MIFFVIFSLKKIYANKAQKRAAVLKIITTFATVVVLIAVIKNIFDVPINVAHTIKIKKELFKTCFITLFLLKINVLNIEININIPI